MSERKGEVTRSEDYQVLKVEAESRIQNHFSDCITHRQLEFLTLYICGEDHEVTDRELEVASDIYTRGYNQAVRDVRGALLDMPSI